MLFVFIVSPLQANYSASDVDIGIEQADISIAVCDAIQPVMINSILQASGVVATPLKYPILQNDLNNNNIQQTCLLTSGNNIALRIEENISDNSQFTNQWNLFDPVNIIKEGRFRLDVGERIALLCNIKSELRNIHSTKVQYSLPLDL